MTTTCTNCKRYVALAPTEDPRVFVAINREDGFSPSGRQQVAGERHACSESDRRAH